MTNCIKPNDFKPNGIKPSDHLPVHIPLVPECRSEAKRSDVPYGHASMLLLGEGSEATEPYNKYDKIRPHSIRSLQFDQKARPLSFRPEKFDLFTATPNQFVENQKRNQDITVSSFFAETSLPKRFCRNVLFPSRTRTCISRQI